MTQSTNPRFRSWAKTCTARAVYSPTPGNSVRPSGVLRIAVSEHSFIAMLRSVWARLASPRGRMIEITESWSAFAKSRGEGHRLVNSSYTGTTC